MYSQVCLFGHLSCSLKHLPFWDYGDSHGHSFTSAFFPGLNQIDNSEVTLSNEHLLFEFTADSAFLHEIFPRIAVLCSTSSLVSSLAAVQNENSSTKLMRVCWATHPSMQHSLCVGVLDNVQVCFTLLIAIWILHQVEWDWHLYLSNHYFSSIVN